MLGLMRLSQRLATCLAVSAIMLAACSPAAATPTGRAETATLAPALVSTTVQTTIPPVVEPAATEPGAAQPSEVAPPTATVGPTVTPFVISDEFTPSDPALVNLAAGQPQLVEFFAFW
jgi:hypothetical protein